MSLPPSRPGGLSRCHLSAPIGIAKVVLFIACFAGIALLSSPVRASADADQGNASSASASEELKIEYIAERLAARFKDVSDVTATISFVQVSPRDGSRSQGQMLLQAIFPDLARAAWIKPDFLSGIVWILDMQRNRFTQYEPTTGAARHHPLDEVLSEQTLIPLAPEQLFSLPSLERFSLEVEAVTEEGDQGRRLAAVHAVNLESGRRARFWVDIDDWLVVRIESLTASGTLELAAWTEHVEINKGLTRSELRSLPPGTAEISLP